MSGYGPLRGEPVRRGETMSVLRDRQRTLNMRLLLAVQGHDEEMQSELERQLQDLARQIGCLSPYTRSSR